MTAIKRASKQAGSQSARAHTQSGNLKIQYRYVGTLKPDPSAPGEIVLDMFAGSGSTLMAAEQLGRACYALELNPLYVDVTVRRWQAATRQAATHAKDKRTFDTTAQARIKGKG